MRTARGRGRKGTGRRRGPRRSGGRIAAIATIAGVSALAAVRFTSATPPSELPALEPEARTILAATADDRDRVDEPVLVVLDALGASGLPGAGDPVVRLDAAAARSDIEAWRGRAVRVEGRLEQASPLATSTDPAAVEWFVRHGTEAVCVVIRRPPAATPGDRVAVAGRVIRRLAAESRDGARRTHVQVAAIGAHAAVGSPVSASRGRGAIAGGAILVPLAAGGLVLVLVLRRVARAGPRGSSSSGAVRRTPRRDATLPSDPADALAELHRRAGGDDAETPR